MKLLLSLLTFVTVSTTYSQESPYQFSARIDSIWRADTLQWKHQVAAWSYANIGAYHSALRMMDQPYLASRKPRSKEVLDKLLSQPRSVLAAYRPTPAADYILKQAQQSRIIIINEAHHMPAHRAFVEGLLPQLKKLGFSCMGIEGLNHEDSLLNRRRYPVLTSGFYVKEPAYGNMIRTALDLGFQLFAYETQRDVNGKDREIDQAANIKRVMDQHPEAKFLIYCGYDHAIEDSTRNGWELAMAGRLKVLTGLDPLTIDQVALTETADPTYDNLFRQALDLTYPAVLIDATGKAFSQAMPNKTYDVQVYHLNTRLVHGRPQWLLAQNERYHDVAPLIRIAYPVLVRIYRAGENPDDAVPVDVFEMSKKQDDVQAIVPKKGKLLVRVSNAANQMQEFSIGR